MEKIMPKKTKPAMSEDKTIRTLFSTLLEKTTKPERDKLFGSKGGDDFIDRVRKYAKKYQLELPTAFKPRLVDKYPITKIDRVTSQNLLSIFLHKGIFTNYSNLPQEEEVLQGESRRLNKDVSALTFDEKRNALAGAKEYRKNGYVIRDYGDYCIGFSCQIYLDYIKEIEDKLEDVLEQPHLFPEVIDRIQRGLETVRLYRLAHNLAYIVLSEVYIQGKVRGVEIPKERVRTLLGYQPYQKHIYQEIDRVFKSLMVCNYVIWGYEFAAGYKKRTDKPSSKKVGFFIYNFKTTHKQYILDVNDAFVGCVETLFLGDRIFPRKERKKLFSRGYFDWPSRILTLTKDEPMSVAMLSDFLIRETGNAKLNKPGIKIIAHKVERFAKEALIFHSRSSRRYNDTLNALGRVEIADKIDPPLYELKQLTPTRGLRTTIHVHVKSDPKELDRLIGAKIKEKSNGQGAKTPPKVMVRVQKHPQK